MKPRGGEGEATNRATKRSFHCFPRMQEPLAYGHTRALFPAFHTPLLRCGVRSCPARVKNAPSSCARESTPAPVLAAALVPSPQRPPRRRTAAARPSRGHAGAEKAFDLSLHLFLNFAKRQLFNSVQFKHVGGGGGGSFRALFARTHALPSALRPWRRSPRRDPRRPW